MGDIVTASGSKLYIGNAVASAAADTLVEFQAMSAWTEVMLIENLGEVGDEASAVTGASVGDARIRKAKGARDAGMQAIVCFHDPLDPGQAAMDLAEQSDNNFAFKLIVADAPAGYNNTIKYYRGLVMSRRQNIGTNDNIIRTTYNVGVNSEIFVDPASV